MDFKKDLQNSLKKQLNKEITLEIPPNPDLGDYSLPCFKIGNSQDIIKIITLPKYIKKAEIKGPYINFFIKKDILAELTIKQIFKEKDKFGSKNIGKGKKAIIEHTSVNPNASPHLGRARNAIIGDSISRLIKFQGYSTEIHYFINDIGKQIAMLVLACKNKKPSFSQLLNLYVEFNKKLEKSPELEKQVFELLNKLENNDKKTISQFKNVVKICIKGQSNIFKSIGINYNQFDYESDYLKETSNILKKIKEKGRLFTDQEKRETVNLEGFNLPMEHPFLPLTRSDKTSLYLLRDLAYTIYKIKKGKDRNILVLGEDQKLYYQQLKAILSILGYKAPEPVFYSFVLLSSGKMSTRYGNVVLLEDFMKDAKNKAINEIKKRHGKIKGIEKLAEKIAYGAIKFTILKVSSEKNVLFEIEKALSFEGESGPYIQYTYTRANSILKKAKTIKKVKLILNSKEEINLINKLSQFPEAVEEAFNHLQPHIIANYALNISKIFNDFYQNCPVLTEKPDIKNARLNLILAYKQTIKNALNLLGIEAPEMM